MENIRTSKAMRKRVMINKVYNERVYNILAHKPNNAKWKAINKFLFTHDS